MKKEKSIFVTEGYLHREVIPIKIEGNGETIKKNNVLLCGTAQLTKIDRSFTKCLTLILQEKKRVCLLFSSLKKSSFDISNKPCIAAQ